jgi:hypothetical protein
MEYRDALIEASLADPDFDPHDGYDRESSFDLLG